MIELMLNEKHELKYGLQVEGTNAGLTEVRLTMEMTSYKLSFPGVYERGICRFTIPSLSGLISEGSYNFKIEAVIEDHYFVPVEDVIQFKKPITIGGALVETKTEKVDIKVHTTEALKETVKLAVVEEKQVGIDTVPKEFLEPTAEDKLYLKLKGIMKS